MSTALATRPAAAPATIGNRQERDRLLKSLILKNASDDQLKLVLAICDRYGFDPLLKHVALIAGALYVTRDGLLHVAHASGRLDGIEATAWQDQEGYWVARCTVRRKDMKHPFVYEAHEREHRNDSSPAWKNAPRAMTIKCAEVMCLRRAFDVSLSGAEELGYDVATGTANLGAAALVEVPRDDEPQRPAPARRPWTVERGLAYIADAANPHDKRVGMAKWIIDQANDLPTITQYRAALVQLLDEDLFADHYLTRYEALGGRVSGRADEPIDAEYEAWPEGGDDEEPA